MGAFCRVKVFYFDVTDFFNLDCVKNSRVYGAFLEGENLYSKSLSESGIIVVGNEANGIAKITAKYITDKIFIPNYPPLRQTSESLNVAIATGIICSEFRRRIL